jgi:hypothetical protein
MEQRTFAAVAALGHEGQMSPDRRVSGRQLDTDSPVSMGRKRPIERRSSVFDFPGVMGQPFAYPPLRCLAFCALEKITVVLGVAVRERFPLAAFGEPFKRVDAGGFEQLQARLGFGRFRDGERFFYQSRDGVDDIALEKVRIGGYGAQAASSVKPPVKIPNLRSTARSGSESTA